METGLKMLNAFQQLTACLRCSYKLRFYEQGTRFVVGGRSVTQPVVRFER